MIIPVTSTSDVGKAAFDKLVTTLKKASNSYVTIGVHQDAGKYTDGPNPPDVVEVALWNEFGTDGGTWNGNGIPERSFMRSAIDENQAKLDQWREQAIENILFKGWDVQKALEFIGFRIQDLIWKKMDSGVEPVNTDATIEAKIAAGEQPIITLQATRLLRRSITYRVVIRD